MNLEEVHKKLRENGAKEMTFHQDNTISTTHGNDIVIVWEIVKDKLINKETKEELK